MSDADTAATPNPVAATLLATMSDRHEDVAALLAGLPPAALEWAPATQANSLADLARHILDIEGHVARDLAGGDPGWSGANGTQVDAPSDSDVLVRRLRAVGQTLAKLLGEVAAEDSERLTVALEEFDHCAIHHGQMQLTRHLWEAVDPHSESSYVHWR